MKQTFPLFFEMLARKGRVFGHLRGRAGLCATLALVAACTAPTPSATINDPDEAKNRDIHAFNVGLDRALVRPMSTAYGAIPVPVQRGVSNFAANLDLPGDVVNGVIQGRPQYALENTLRFAINSTIGIAGLFDPATAIGVPGKKTDFGETLHVWGAGEGVYVELPGFGPSTERDAVGTVVDIVMNPVSKLLPSPESYVATGAKIASKLGDRSRYSDTFDQLLYESADSYAQARLLYLQNRRFELGQTAASDEAFLDPYEDPYAQ